jgi:hypothetical protein
MCHNTNAGQRRILIDELTVVSQGKSTHRITEVAIKALNTFDQEHFEHPVSSAYPAILVPPSSPFRPESPIMDGHFEGSSTEEKVHHLRCTYTFCLTACTDC